MAKGKKKKKNDKNKGPNRWIILSGIGFQMGATIFLCAWGGKKLDAYYLKEDQNYFTIGLVLFGVIASLWVTLKQLKRLEQ